MIGIGIPISQSNRPLPIGVLRFSTADFLPRIKQYPRGIQILNGRRLSLVPSMGSRQFEEDSFSFLDCICCCCCIAGRVSRGNCGIICRSLNSRWSAVRIACHGLPAPSVRSVGTDSGTKLALQRCSGRMKNLIPSPEETPPWRDLPMLQSCSRS